jgi:shikimate kinase
MSGRADERNIVLIGMPGVGKSTVGVLLAKALSRSFLDTDVLIQAREGRRLQDIIDSDGIDAFCRLEEKHVLGIECRGHVIATGGSVVYSEPAMKHLRAGGFIVHLDLPLGELKARLRNLDSRGVVMAPGQSIAELYEERLPLYRRYADATVQCAGLTHEEVVAAVVEALGR